MTPVVYFAQGHVFANAMAGNIILLDMAVITRTPQDTSATSSRSSPFPNE